VTLTLARLELLSVVVIASAVALVGHRARTARAPATSPPATTEASGGFAASIASREDEWREKAADGFPGDQWSQRDAFHGHESTAVRDVARSNGVSYEQVLRAVDQDIHRSRGRERSAEAVRCKPRPFYD